MDETPSQRRRRHKREYAAFDRLLHDKPLCCELCGAKTEDGAFITDSTTRMKLNQRSYDVCSRCLRDRSIWYHEDGQPRRLPQIPESRAGQFTAKVLEQIEQFWAKWIAEAGTEGAEIDARLDYEQWCLDYQEHIAEAEREREEYLRGLR